MRSPVFRHAGSWRHAGMVRRAFHPIAPRRRCGAVASIVVECILLCIRGVSRHDDGLPPPPGWHLCGCCWRSPHVADTPVGEIRGYAQRQPLAGWRKCSPLVIVSAAGGVGGRCAATRLDGGVGGRCAATMLDGGVGGRFAAPGFALLWLRFEGAWGIVGTKKSMPKHRFQINPKT